MGRTQFKSTGKPFIKTPTKTSAMDKAVPVKLAAAMVETATHNAQAFTMQMCMEQMLLMLHDTFGFGRDRCMKAMVAYQERYDAWRQNIEEEFSAETLRMNFKQREAHRTELAWTWEKHDAELEPLIDPKIWVPYKDRYRSFGGRGSWCD